MRLPVSINHDSDHRASDTASGTGSLRLALPREWHSLAVRGSGSGSGWHAVDGGGVRVTASASSTSLSLSHWPQPEAEPDSEPEYTQAGTGNH